MSIARPGRYQESAEVGRERVLWGSGYGEKLTSSDNVRIYDFIRADARYKAIRYTFMHAWLGGQTRTIPFTLPFDTTALFYEPVAADKYFAAHRFELMFPGVLDVGNDGAYHCFPEGKGAER